MRSELLRVEVLSLSVLRRWSVSAPAHAVTELQGHGRRSEVVMVKYDQRLVTTNLA